MNVKIEVLEPVENGNVVFQALAPAKKGNPQQGRISVRIRIKNDDTKAITINRVEIAGKPVSSFASPVLVAANASFEFQNCNCPDSQPLIINAPFPATVKIAVVVANEAAPVEKVVTILPHTNDGGP